MRKSESRANSGKNNPMCGKNYQTHGLVKRMKEIKGKTYEEIYGKEKAEKLSKGIGDTFRGKPKSEKHREKIGKKSRERWKNPEYRKFMLGKLEPTWNDPKRNKKISEGLIKNWENPEFAKKILKGLLKRPTRFENKIAELCISHNLPFIYTGNGTFLIGHKNPDFVNKKDKIAIEVYYSYFKIRDFRSCEEYERRRGEYFAKYGYQTIFIKEDDLESKNWEEVCLNKIKFKGGE